MVEYVVDNFEKTHVDSRIWLRRQIKWDQVTFSNDADEGDWSIVIKTEGDDRGSSCGDVPCQRAELRLHGNLRPVYGEDVWYGFSFKISGDIPDFGSNRTVIGQWKAPRDDSPFLAQRFDNGVFHITIEDEDTRKVVATAKGDPDRLSRFQERIAQTAETPTLGPKIVRAARAYADLKAFRKSEIGTITGPLSAEATELQNAAGNLPESASEELEKLFEEFDYVQDIEKFMRRANVEVKQQKKHLPDPKQGWVRMAYRIKGGRTDNVYGPVQQGEIDIYANGELIAEVRGNFGQKLLSPLEDATMYFKFGMYRDKIPNAVKFFFDRFRQGRSFAEVS